MNGSVPSKLFCLNSISFHLLKIIVILWIGVNQINGIPSLLDIVQSLRELVDELPKDPELEITALQSIRRNGFPAEAHVILTEDNYLLTAHRIPCGRNCTTQGGRGKGQPVLLVHGFLCSSSVWLISGPEKGLAYILANAGYDVWMLNARGTVYSKAHAELSVNPKSNYWDFSWHEMGLYDVAAHVDYIYALKYDEGYRSYNPNDMIIISHSMGATMVYVLLSLRPEYNEKVAAVFNLAPIGYTKYVTGPLRLASPMASMDLEALIWFAGGNEYLRNNNLMKYFTVKFCTQSKLQVRLCENLLFSIGGYNRAQFNDSLIGRFMNTIPEGTSTKSVIHYGQEVNAGGRFQQFDNGIKRNLEVYGQPTPPEYDISKITAPMASYYGDRDLLSVGQDVIDFDAQLRNSLGVKSYPFEHLDFLVGIDADRWVYSDMLRKMARFQ